MNKPDRDLLSAARSELRRLIRARRHCDDLTCCFNATPRDCECTNLATWLDPALKIARDPETTPIDHPANTFRCHSDDGTAVMVCADIDDAAPSLLFYPKRGTAFYIMLTADDADALADALHARAAQYREAVAAI